VDGASPQSGLGELSPTEFASALTAITTAFGDPTRREIDLHANVARHHLDKLVAGGYLEVQVAKPSGGVGRPSKRYKATTPEVRLEVAIRHDDILVSLLGRAMAASIDPSETHRSYQGALHAVADALSAHGFAARAEATEGDEYQIVTQNCTFGDAAVEQRLNRLVERVVATIITEERPPQRQPSSGTQQCCGLRQTLVGRHPVESRCRDHKIERALNDVDLLECADDHLQVAIRERRLQFICELRTQLDRGHRGARSGEQNTPTSM
jgi:predicted ArsR family transcriptional regulator